MLTGKPIAVLVLLSGAACGGQGETAGHVAGRDGGGVDATSADAADGAMQDGCFEGCCESARPLCQDPCGRTGLAFCGTFGGWECEFDAGCPDFADGGFACGLGPSPPYCRLGSEYCSWWFTLEAGVDADGPTCSPLPARCTTPTCGCAASPAACPGGTVFGCQDDPVGDVTVVCE